MSKEQELLDTIRSPNYAKFERLLEEVDLSYTDERGQTATHIAAALGNFEYLSELLDRGAPVDITDNDGATPLYRAVESILCDGLAFGEDFRGIIRILVQRGANIAEIDAEDLNELATNEDGTPDEITQNVLQSIRIFATTVATEATTGDEGIGEASETEAAIAPIQEELHTFITSEELDAAARVAVVVGALLTVGASEM